MGAGKMAMLCPIQTVHKSVISADLGEICEEVQIHLLHKRDSVTCVSSSQVAIHRMLKPLLGVSRHVWGRD